MKDFIRKIRKLILLPIRKIQFGYFGSRSDYISPIMITGKSHIYIDNYTVIRNNARIEAITNFYGTRYDPKLNIGKRVTIEQGVHITCTDRVSIGDNTTISSYVYISDTEHDHKVLGKNIFDLGLIVKPVEIGKCVFIGTGAKILSGVSIGDNCVVGANSVVTRNIPCNSMVAGIPARIIKIYDDNKKIWVIPKETIK